MARLVSGNFEKVELAKHPATAGWDENCCRSAGGQNPVTSRNFNNFSSHFVRATSDRVRHRSAAQLRDASTATPAPTPATQLPFVFLIAFLHEFSKKFSEFEKIRQVFSFWVPRRRRQILIFATGNWNAKKKGIISKIAPASSPVPN